ncbi:MAG: RNase adapter RapZ [Candidatus Aminicenantes bacterium]|jgi:UPF0042 nucleotide-binding protein|nr:RNase adapter RapZ [Candidatus Aminicenantes bacterium]
MTRDKFLIIAGLSGSGKTVVSHFFEDLGYYRVDNLPAKLIPSFVDLWLHGKVEIGKVALVVDIREPSFLKEFPRVWKEIRRKVGARLLFLDATDEALVKRFSETRRPHPLARKSVVEGVRLERKRLAPIKNMADEVIDTTRMSIVQLKELLGGRFAARRAPRLQITLISFGYKYGIPLESDLVFDTRFLPNPFYVESLREKSGRQRGVRDFVLGAAETKAFLAKLREFLDFLIPHFVREGKSYLTISVGCTGGKHRSVVVAETLREYLRRQKCDIKLYHRDMFK